MTALDASAIARLLVELGRRTALAGNNYFRATVRPLFTGMANDTAPRAKPLANTLLRCRRQAAMTAALKVHRLSA